MTKISTLQGSNLPPKYEGYRQSTPSGGYQVYSVLDYWSKERRFLPLYKRKSGTHKITPPGIPKNKIDFRFVLWHI